MNDRSMKFRKVWPWILGVVIVAPFFVLSGLYYLQEKILFFPSTLSRDYRFHFDQPFEERWFDVGGKKVHSLLFHADAATIGTDATDAKPHSHGVLLYFHGNARNLSWWGKTAEDLILHAPWDVWMVDFPGFGKSDGPISSEQQLHEIAEAMWKEAAKEYGEARVIIFGRSMGTGLAAKLASEHDSAGLVLETPYYSLAAMATARFPWAPSSLLRYSMRSDLWMRKVKTPVLIFHGTDDHVIPYEQAQALAALAIHGELVTIPGGHHSDLGESDFYWKSLEKWLDERILQKDSAP